jgi:hypothetical protein
VMGTDDNTQFIVTLDTCKQMPTLNRGWHTVYTYCMLSLIVISSSNQNKTSIFQSCA